MKLEDYLGHEAKEAASIGTKSVSTCRAARRTAIE